MTGREGHPGPRPPRLSVLRFVVRSPDFGNYKPRSPNQHRVTRNQKLATPRAQVGRIPFQPGATGRCGDRKRRCTRQHASYSIAHEVQGIPAPEAEQTEAGTAAIQMEGSCAVLSVSDWLA